MSADNYLAGTKLLVSFSDVQSAVEAQAQKLNIFVAEQQSVYPEGEGVVALTLLNGGIIYAGMLLPLLNFKLELDAVGVSRYRDKDYGGELTWNTMPRVALHNKLVILLDDIFDQGITLQRVAEWCVEQGALSVSSSVLAWKQLTPPAVGKPDFYALTIPDAFVVGMGMDYAGYYRNAPGIYALQDFERG